MEKKEHYRHILPHFQQPGQAYFITWNLKNAVPKKALKRYSEKLEILKSQLRAFSHAPGAADSNPLIFRKRDLETAPQELRKQYYTLRRKYIKAYNDLLDADKNPELNLSKPENTNAIKETLQYWTDKKLENYAFCIMPNHVHWVFRLLERDESGNPCYLQDILYSVKRFSANQINKLENRKGTLWQKESFDTTIRDEKHLFNAIEYTLNNPVNAGLIHERKNWTGNWYADL